MPKDVVKRFYNIGLCPFSVEKSNIIEIFTKNVFINLFKKTFL